MTMNCEKMRPLYMAARLKGVARGESVWLQLPANKKQFADALEKIGGDKGFTITEYAHSVPMISDDMIMSVPLAMVNYLAARLNKLSDYEVSKLCALRCTDHLFGYFNEFIDFTYASDDYGLLPGVTDAFELAEYHIAAQRRKGVDEKLLRCIDRYDFGRRLAELDNGVFTPFGYLTSKTGWSYKLKERSVPENLNLKGLIGEDVYGEDAGEDYDYGNI